MTTLTVGRVTELPRVNLLPPEVAQASRFRRVQVLLALVLLATLGVIAASYLFLTGQVSSAQSSLDAAQSENTALKAEVAQYADVPRVKAELAKAQADLETAMAPEVRWSFYLNDLSLTIPNNVRINTMAIIQPVPTNPLPTDVGISSPLGTPGIATINFEGTAASYDAVASWLRSLARQKGYTDPTVTQVTDSTVDNQVDTVYTFSSSVTVTDKAYSGRYTSTAGE
jgi:Tfp pilus assembly protein PilN